jgi:hypothetical protein
MKMKCLLNNGGCRWLPDRLGNHCFSHLLRTAWNNQTHFGIEGNTALEIFAFAWERLHDFGATDTGRQKSLGSSQDW